MTSEQFKKRFLPLHNRLYPLAFKYLGNRFDAEDAMQTLYLKLWERRDSLNDIDNDMAFCRQVLNNICIDKWRALNNRRQVPLSEAGSLAESECFEVSDSAVRINAFIKRLPDKQRRVIKMSMAGAGTNEINSVTGLSVVNIRTILSRIRQQLRNIYKDE